MTPQERSMRARLAAHALHAKRDSHAIAARARDGRWQKYLELVDPDGVLPEKERERRAEHARKADMLRLALKSAQARRKKKA